MNPKKMARIFSDFASNKVAEVKTTAERNERLQLVVWAWNCSYWDDESKRNIYIDKIESYYDEKNMPSELKIKNLHLLRNYIAGKRKEIPHPKNQILEYSLEELGNNILAFHLCFSKHEG